MLMKKKPRPPWGRRLRAFLAKHEHGRATCGAHARSTGKPCKNTVVNPENGRCRLHGGLSTGPKTEAGRQRIADAQKARHAAARVARRAERAAERAAMEAECETVAAKAMAMAAADPRTAEIRARAAAFGARLDPVAVASAFPEISTAVSDLAAKRKLEKI